MRVGVLTGGGDCPGLNPAIRGAVVRGLKYGFEMVGILDGWKGIMEMETMPLTRDVVEEILGQGGTILGSSRTNPFKEEASAEIAMANYAQLRLDALIAIGGDDTLGVAEKLARRGYHAVGVPKTMDNDLSCTDYTFGFDSAVSVGVDAIDRLRDTAKSHRRIMVVEAMGRNAGWVALWMGMAGAADWILIPEEPIDIPAMTGHLMEKYAQGKRYGIVVASEGISFLTIPAEQRALLTRPSQAILSDVDAEALRSGKLDQFDHPTLSDQKVGPRIAELIENETGIETRSVVLGHTVRGGSPSVFDRILGTRVGAKAADMVHDGQWGYMAALRGMDVVAVPLADAVGVNKRVTKDWYDTAQIFFR